MAPSRRESLSAYPGATMRTLTNGSIQHGTQIFSPELRNTPTTYYAEDSGVGLAMRFCCQGYGRNIGVVGLGAGTIAAYGRRYDKIRFYEINPAVYPIAQHAFTYMRDSAAQVDSVEGDARTTLANEPPMGFDVLVVDAFSATPSRSTYSPPRLWTSTGDTSPPRYHRFPYLQHPCRS